MIGRLEGHPAHKTLGVGLLVVSFALHVLQLQLPPPSLSFFVPIKSRMETFCYQLARVALESGHYMNVVVIVFH